MTNILEAIYNIITYKHFNIRNNQKGRNQVNSMGQALESYIKDAFANTFKSEYNEARLNAYSKVFSWLGSQNNPPDIIIKNGDAIEVKKIQNKTSSLALNSSYPKSNLDCDSPMITTDCKNCEDWKEKDLIYCIGHTTDTKVLSIWMIYGSIYAAKKEVYERIKTTISKGIVEIPTVIFSETRELGRVNQVDPLGITSLRIRGMWQIENPQKVFDYIYKPTPYKFELMAIIPFEKYNSFPSKSKNKIESIKEKGFTIENKKVKNPNNPAQLVNCKIIKFTLI